MDNGEVFDLLSLVQAHDSRTVGQSDLHVWADAADRARWTFDEACEAVKAHHAESTEWIKPAHVTQRIRRDRSAPPPSGQLPQAPPANPEHVRRVIDYVANRLAADREMHASEHRDALRIDCPECGAHAGSPCVQTIGHMRPRAGNLPIEVPHVQRRRAYRAMQPPPEPL